MGSYSNNTKVQTLSTVEELIDVQFGHRFPRHGLKLLHWLAKDFIEFDGYRRMLAQFDPKTGKFGFHPFRNKENILPAPPANSEYFEVGNLNSSGAWALPFVQVQQGNDQSNTDRIILWLDPGQVIGKVYITNHTPHSLRFSPDSTYCLTDGLIWNVKGLSLPEFLRQAGYIQGPNENFTDTIPQRMERRAAPKKNEETVVNVPDFPRDSNGKNNRVCDCIIL